MAIISKGIKLAYEGTEGTFTELTNLLEIPALGGTAESIEITTLADAAHVYTDGLLNYGDSLAFKFNYEEEQFLTLVAFEGVKKWMVTLPDGVTCSFSGTASAGLDGVGINAAMTYTLSIKPSTEMIWA